MKNSTKIIGGFFSLVALLSSLIYAGQKQAGVQIDSVPPRILGAATDTCPYLFVSWNLENFGRSKSPETIALMAKVLRNADIVAVQEVNAGGNFGAQTVASLADSLSRLGANWDYIVSNKTQPASPGAERYGYFLKKNTVTFSRDSAHLVSELETQIDREPFALTVTLSKEPSLQLFTIHTVPTKKGPEQEVEALLLSHEVTNASRGIFAGDFNLPATKTDKLFESMGYKGAIREKTSLKEKLDVNGGYRFHQYDNIYTKGVTVCESGVIDFVGDNFSPVTDESLQVARKVSDHLPVYIRFK